MNAIIPEGRIHLALADAQGELGIASGSDGIIRRFLKTSAAFGKRPYVGSGPDGLLPFYDLRPRCAWFALPLYGDKRYGAITCDGLDPAFAKACATERGRRDEPVGWRAHRETFSACVAFAQTVTLRLALGAQYADALAEATTDPLTGCVNRDVAFEALGRMLGLGREATVVVVDLDGLKAINDTFGHAEGDSFISRAANALRAACRTTDIIARFGGDEFLIVADGDVRSQLLARMREAFAAAKIGASIGCARAPIDAAIPKDIFAIADARMYEEKHEHHAARAVHDTHDTHDTHAAKPL
ncbi:MAG: GGDEF domain-containing protein [Vulcanimicrobiaceae bacterium]